MKLHINIRKISGKASKIWKLNNLHLDNPWVKEEIKRVIRKYFELSENEYTTYNLWHSAKAVVRG